MGAILDIIGSYVFKAAMIGIILATSINLNGVMVEKMQLTIAEKNLNVAISILEWDLKNIGYNYTGSPAIVTANMYYIQFYADVQNDGTADLVQWSYQYIGYDEEAGYIYNMVRSVNGVAYVVVRRVYWTSAEGVSWRFTYLDKDGSITSDLSKIKGLSVYMKTKSDIKLNNQFILAEREFTVFPPNLSL